MKQVLQITDSDLDTLATQVAFVVYETLMVRSPMPCPRDRHHEVIECVKSTGADVFQRALNRLNSELIP